MTKCDFCVMSQHGECLAKIGRNECCSLAIQTLSKVVAKQQLLEAVEPVGGNLIMNDKITLGELKEASKQLQPLVSKLSPHEAIVITANNITLVADELGLPVEDKD